MDIDRMLNAYITAKVENLKKFSKETGMDYWRLINLRHGRAKWQVADIYRIAGYFKRPGVGRNTERPMRPVDFLTDVEAHFKHGA